MKTKAVCPEMSQYSDEWLDRVRQKDSIIENNVDGGLHQLVRNMAGELLELRRLYRELLEDALILADN